MKLDPSDGSPHLGLGDIRVKQKNFAPALEEYRTAEQLDPDDPDAFKSAGKVLLDKRISSGAAADDAEALVHRRLSLAEKAFGPTNPALVRPLFGLGGLELQQANYAMAEKYFSRAYELNVKNFGENSLPASESLRKMSDVYEAQSMYDKAEPYLLRAVKASEISAGPENDMTGLRYGRCVIFMIAEAGEVAALLASSHGNSGEAGGCEQSDVEGFTDV